MRMSSVTAIMVTYGDRSDRCTETSEAALQAGVEKIVIVMNKAAPSSKELLAKYAEEKPGVVLVDSPVNTGSAGGFAIGLAKAMELEADLFLLLDDDNKIKPDALQALVGSFRELAEVDPGAKIPPTLCSFRTSSRNHRYILSGMPESLVFLQPGAAMNLDIRQYFKRRRWIADHSPVPAPQARFARMHYAPWGGLLLHRDTVEAIGLPDTALVLYQDDVEYTARIHAAGGLIYLVRDSHVDDIEPTWHSRGTAGRGAGFLISTGDTLRLHYYTRNRAWLDRGMAHNAGDKVMLAINALAFVTYAAISALRTRKFDEFMAILRGMSEGYRGNLSSGPPLP